MSLMLKLISFFEFEGVSTLENLSIDCSSQINSIHYKIQVNESHTTQILIVLIIMEI